MKRLGLACLLVVAGCVDEGPLPFSDNQLFTGSGGQASTKSCSTQCNTWAENCGYPVQFCSQICGTQPSYGACIIQYSCDQSAIESCTETSSGGSGGGSGGSSSCYSSWSYYSQSCDTCMRNYCCSELQSCDAGTACRNVDDCRLSYCTSGTVDEIVDCTYSQCDYGASALSTWDTYFQCLTGTCNSACSS